MIDPRVQRLGLFVGFDDDNPDLHQFTHVCWPYPHGALCRSSRLWFSGRVVDGDDERYTIDCVGCVECLDQLGRWVA